MQNLIGRTLGRYRIVEQIGAGGMGVVYRAHDEHLDRDVAIKVLPEEVSRDADRVARFQREAKAVAQLDHPNILAIHDFGSDEGSAGVTYSAWLFNPVDGTRHDVGPVKPADDGTWSLPPLAEGGIEWIRPPVYQDGVPILEATCP